MDNVIESLHNNLSEQRDQDVAEQPAYSDADRLPPQPPQPVRLQIPLYHAVAWQVLLGLIIVIYLVEVVRSGGLTPTSQVLFDLGAKWNPAIVDGQYWRLLTATFLHGSLLHILFNGYSLYAVGPAVERFFGTARFLAVYFISGLAGSVASYAFSPSLSVGASGAIFGLVGGLAAFFYASRATLGDMARQQLGSLATVVMINLFIGFGSGGSIDNFAHIGGMLGGAAVGLLLAPRLTIDERLYPPVVTRRFLPYGWAGALLVLALLAALVLYVIKPPL